MIKGFEEITHDLTKKELELVPELVRLLKLAKDKNNIWDNNQLRFFLEKECDLKLGEIKPSRIRAMIHYIRVSGLVPMLCSNSKGYYIGTEKECFEYLESLKERILAIASVYSSIKKQVNTNEFQLKLDL